MSTSTRLNSGDFSTLINGIVLGAFLARPSMFTEAHLAVLRTDLKEAALELLKGNYDKMGMILGREGSFVQSAYRMARAHKTRELAQILKCRVGAARTIEEALTMVTDLMEEMPRELEINVPEG